MGVKSIQDGRWLATLPLGVNELLFDGHLDFSEIGIAPDQGHDLLDAIISAVLDGLEETIKDFTVVS